MAARALVLAILASAVAACVEPAPLALPSAAGGATTVGDRSSNAYSFPATNLAPAELAMHLAGDLEFEATFVVAPAPVNPGLGPHYNSVACGRCHLRDGRGLPVAGGAASSLVVHVSGITGDAVVPGGPVPVPALGNQLQDHATFGVAAEATVAIRWVERSGAYGDGEPYTLRAPRLDITLADGRPLPGDVMVSPRIPPPVFGLGLLEAVPDAQVLELADPADADGDGVSGRANRVWDRERGAMGLGRFGWKAGVATLRQQAAAAYAEDLGVTTALRPAADGTAELPTAALDAVAFYTQTLAVPAPAAPVTPSIRRGAALFGELGCAACHVATLRTGAHPIAALRDQEIHPYTDLLLHNVGFDLADGRPEFAASGTEWRTAPLWGLGLIQTVTPGAGLLHDGRARTIAEAILWHGGEAAASSEGFRAAAAVDRAALLAFLGAL